MKRFLTVLALACSALSAHALSVISVSPQGEVSRVRQVVVKLDAAGVRFGDPEAKAPMLLKCNDALATEGTGRWTNEKEWVFDFKQDLPPGIACQLAVIPGFKSPAGDVLQDKKGQKAYVFSTGGPYVKQVRPGTYGPIDEEQFFALQLNGAATLESVRANMWCAVPEVGERVPVRLLDDKSRAEFLKQLGWADRAAKAPNEYITLACNRRLTAGSTIQLVYGKGVATPSGVANRIEKRFDFQVRDAFAADFTCERTQASKGCMPIRPMMLTFNAPVSYDLAQAIRLKSPTQTIKPEPGDPSDAQGQVYNVQFSAPLAPSTSYVIEIPKDFKDVSDRTLRNAAQFPLKVSTDAMPPLAKFAASPFGIVERYAEGPNGPALLPVTLRNVEAALVVKATQNLSDAAASTADKTTANSSANPSGKVSGKVSTLQPQSDADIIAWYRKVSRYNETTVGRDQAKQIFKGPLPAMNPSVPLTEYEKDFVQTRMLSMLHGQPGVQTLDLPKPLQQDPRPFEVVGIPLKPGFNVVEIASQLLGSALLDERFGADRTMYVRTTALVTNLGVHLKTSRENTLVWVTTLDKGQPVAGAQVQVSNCEGQVLLKGVTNAQGFVTMKALDGKDQGCSEYGDAQWFVSARATAADGSPDMAFTWSHWQEGIEPWRFDLPITYDWQDWPVQRAHTIFDRTLLRAGQTVSMKHVLRTESMQGFSVPEKRPDVLSITHIGSGTQYTDELVWKSTPTGGLSAESTFAIPPNAKLGAYSVELQNSTNGDERSLTVGQFRVEEFRLPVFQGQIGPKDSKAALVRVRELPTQVQVNYVAGGPAAALPVRVSAMVRNKSVSFADYDEFQFEPPRPVQPAANEANNTQGQEEDAASDETRVIADKLPLMLDRHGAGLLKIENIPQTKKPRELVLEATYADPNGEVQTISSTQTLWPANVVAGIKTQSWVSVQDKAKFQVLALDTAGKPSAGVSLKVRAVARVTTSTRKRMVGGFYSYDNQTTIKDLGAICTGKSDARGLLLCDARLSEPGQVELVATATDSAGNTSEAASTVWVSRKDEMWFGGEDHDRVDLLPEKKSYQPGETAKFQVRMPFRLATALVTVEREGVIEAQVVELNGKDPSISLKIKDEWGPNVYVSVFALRGRLIDVPWYSFFTWGFKTPVQWWNAFWYGGKEYVAPTALVDLAKPAFRIGVAEIRVGTQAHQMQVKVVADKASYPVRGKAQVTVTATLPNGQPAAGAQVAFAAVDQALLELMPNNSWNLLEAMLKRRSWGVSTATAQMEIIGRRHYGRKAVPAGGGGGATSGTRELFDTLLLWQPSVQLDAKGQARITVPLNDALTTFKLVAVADAQSGLFGTGSTTIAATQDLQIISGLPPLVREGDSFKAQITLRNTTAKAMTVQVTPRATLIDVKPQTVSLAAGAATEVAWMVKAPEQLGHTRTQTVLWEIAAKDTQGGAVDALKISQRIIPAVPVQVQQANLVQLDSRYVLPVEPPAQALPGRGGIRIALQPKLAEGLPGVRDWWAQYPFYCLEQKTSKAIGMRDVDAWQSVMAQLPTYLDEDGLAYYFPPSQGQSHQGSDTLTAYILAAADEAEGINPEFELPAEARADMLRGLTSFVLGKTERKFWSPRTDLDMRKLAAIEALSRYGAATPAMLTSITIAPNQWPTHAVLDWYMALQRMGNAPQRTERMAEASQILRSRLSYQGTKLIFSTEQDDYWWWLMQNGDVNTARLMLAVMQDPAWKGDMGRLANGFIARQQNGAWHTTTANLWGGFALEKFSAVFEADPVTGTTQASLAGNKAQVDWAQVKPITSADSSGAAHQKTTFGAPAAPGMLQGNTMMLPWAGDKPASPAVASSASPAAPADRVLEMTHTGTGKPWATVQSLAAVPRTKAFAAGYAIEKTITPVDRANPNLPAGVYTRGDVLRIQLKVTASSDMTWVAITDPIPAGATILGGGLGRDSAMATQGENASGNGWAAFEERSFEAFRSYYQYLPKGVVTMEYTVRLNNVGEFALPASRAEAMYAPEMFGESPNAKVKVEAAK